MVRKQALAAALLGVLATRAYALGLGDIQLKSALNQPLDAEIVLLSARPDELESVKVGLASPDAYAQAGLDRSLIHSRFRFEVVRKPNGKAVVRITTREPIREPYLDFLVEATWNAGQVLREYTVLVDPPALMPAPTPVVQAPVTRSAVGGQPPAARRAPVSRPRPAPRPVAPRPAAQSAPGEYGPVQRNETLWNIAKRVRPDGSVTMEQVMLGLLAANPEAFTDGNINNLKAGYVLRVPGRDELTRISPQRALAEVRRHHRLWREGRSAQTRVAAGDTEAQKAEASPQVTASPPAEESSPAAADAGPAEPQLKLVAPEPGERATAEASGGGTAEPADVTELRKELALAIESVEAQKQENAALNARVQQLEEQIASLHRMIELKDETLARLQQQAQPEPEAPVTGAGGEAGKADEAAAAGAAAGTESRADPFGWLRDPLVQGVAGFAVLLFGALAWSGMRRRKAAEEEDLADLMAAESAAGPETSPPATAEQTRTVAAAAVEEAGERAVETPLYTDFETTEPVPVTSASAPAEAEADPLAEADVYLAYGRYQQAEELIRTAIDREPDRTDLRVKLLEVFHAARNATGFDAAAEDLLARLESEDDPAWQRVAEMGRELNPASPLYEPKNPAAAARSEAATRVAEADDVDPEDMAPVGQNQADNSLDFDLGELADAFGSDALAATEDEGDAGEGALTEADEVSTKLDLARAYVEMGDPEGARSILNEVLEEGDDNQKREAQTLLSQLG